MKLSSTHLIWAILGFVWGSTWVFIKVGLEDLPPFTFATLRFGVAVVPLVLFAWGRGLKFPRLWADWALLGSTGLISFAASYGLVFWGEQYISSGLTALLFCTYPFFSLLLAHFFLPSEPLTIRRLGGVFIGIAGVAVIFADQAKAEGAMGLWGSLAVLVSAALSPLSGILIKRRGSHLDPAIVSVCQMTVGGIPLAVAALLFERGAAPIVWTPKALFSLFYLGLVGSSLAFVLWYKLIQRTDVTRAQMMPLINTLVAVVLGSLFLGERYGLQGAVGAAAVIGGLALTLWTQKSVLSEQC